AAESSVFLASARKWEPARKGRRLSLSGNQERLPVEMLLEVHTLAAAVHHREIRDAVERRQDAVPDIAADIDPLAGRRAEGDRLARPIFRPLRHDDEER